VSIYEHFEKHSHRTFKEASERYLEDFQGKDKRRQMLAIASVLPYIGHLRLIEVDDEALAIFKSDRRSGVGHFDRPAMVGTINKELTTVVTVLNKACHVYRWIPSAPKLVRVKGEVRSAYPLSWDEQDALFFQFTNGWDRGALLFAVNTGVRRGELFSLRWEDMVALPDLKTFVFILRGTKNGQDRAVICNSIARRVVAYQEGNGSDFVFPCKGDEKTRVHLPGKIFSQAWINAGLPGDSLTRKGIHNLRHTCGQRLRAAGVPEEDRNSILGHCNTNLAQHYAIPDVARLSEATELITVRKDSTILRSVRRTYTFNQSTG